MNITLIILMFIYTRGTQGSHEEAQKFLVDNGHSYVNIVLHSTNSEWSTFRPKYVAYTRTMIGNQVDMSNTVLHMFICGPDQDNLRKNLEIIVERKNGMSLLLFDKHWSQTEKRALQLVLKSLEARILFYVGTLSITA